MFTKKQIEFMNANGIDVDFNKKISVDDYIMIEEKVSHLLQKVGFDENYEANEVGIMCEEIIDSMD